MVVARARPFIDRLIALLCTRVTLLVLRGNPLDLGGANKKSDVNMQNWVHDPQDNPPWQDCFILFLYKIKTITIYELSILQ